MKQNVAARLKRVLAGIVQWFGRAKDRHDPVAHYADHGTAPRMDQIDDVLEIAIEKLDDFFRAHAFAACGISADIEKHDAHVFSGAPEVRRYVPGQYFLHNGRTHVSGK